MSLNAKKFVIVVLSAAFLVSLLFVQWMEVLRKKGEVEDGAAHVAVPASSKECVDCHADNTPGVVDHWLGSSHAAKGVGCYECHEAHRDDADAFDHYGQLMATVVTPLDCGRCHTKEFEEFTRSHHAKGGNILASLDNRLAEVTEGMQGTFNPHSPTPGRPEMGDVNGFASANTGCKQCHGSKVALKGKDGELITFEELMPDEDGRPTNARAVAAILKDANGKPKFDSSTWPNTGIGRLNLDGSRGSCSACHSRHDFSPRRARQPENCGKCHLGPDHPQKEIYEESKHGVAYRDLRDKMNLDAESWVLGVDYSAAPTCATCHMSANKNDPTITHDPGERISWTNRPPVSLVMDTDRNHAVIKVDDPEQRARLVQNGGDSWQAKRTRMSNVCKNCHTPDYITSFYEQYDDFVQLYNEKFGKPGQALMAELRKQGLISAPQFDEEIEWTWFYLWHHEGRRARHGASMMAPDYAHWHGMYEVAERFYMELLPQAKEIVEHALESGKEAEAGAVQELLDEIEARPEHVWSTEALPAAGSHD